MPLLSVTRSRMHKFYIDFKEAVVAVNTKREVLQQNNGNDNHFEFFTDLRGFRVYSNTVNWKPCKGQKVIFKGEGKTRIPTTNLLLLEKTC